MSTRRSATSLATGEASCVTAKSVVAMSTVLCSGTGRCGDARNV